MKNFLAFVVAPLFAVLALGAIFYIGASVPEDTEQFTSNTPTMIEKEMPVELLVEDDSNKKEQENIKPRTETTKVVRIENTARSTTPECSDGIDNDGDGRIDYPLDRGCGSPEGHVEKAPRVFFLLSASPSPTRENAATSLTWEVLNGESCVLSGDNGDSWILTGISGQQSSSLLTQPTFFTLKCKNLDEEFFSTSILVEVLPPFGAQ